MAEVRGRTPADNRERSLDIWVDDRGVHLWIHPPDSDNQAGWEVVVDQEQLRAALRDENLIAG